MFVCVASCVVVTMSNSRHSTRIVYTREQLMALNKRVVLPGAKYDIPIELLR